MMSFENYIKDILTIARGEMVLESMITTIKDDWNGFEIELVKY